MSLDTQNLPTLDTQSLESISSDRLFLIEVCDSFLADAPTRIDAVDAAIAADNSSALKSTAHALKSLSGCVGAMRLFEFARQMEVVGKSNRTRPAMPLIEQAKLEYEKVQAVIETYKNNQ